MFEEGGNEVAEEGLSVGGFAAEMAVFEVAAGHGEEGLGEGKSVEQVYGRFKAGGSTRKMIGSSLNQC